jgi:tetratricopeptide (TPR) repeat protein
MRSLPSSSSIKPEVMSHRFFRHLREGQLLRENALTWLAVGEAARTLPPPLLVRAVHDRLSELVAQICTAPTYLSRPERARRLREIFRRHVLGGEHWSILTAELFISRREFFRVRKLLCNELCKLLQLGPQLPTSAAIVQPSRDQLVYNEAYLALEAGNIELSERILETLCASSPSGDLHSRALLLAADCAMERLRFDTAAALCSLAFEAARVLTDFDDRMIASARVSVARSRYYMLVSDYHRANQEIDAALSGLSRLSCLPDPRRCELMKVILARQAELAIHVGDFNRALEHVHRAKYTTGPNVAASEATFDLAASEAATETFSGHFQNALLLLEEALASAERLGFNRQIARLSIEHAWVECSADSSRGRLLAPRVAALAEAVRVPALTLEASLFCAVNERPKAAITYASRARYASPPSSLSAARATAALAVACYDLGRLADALDLAREVEKLSDALDNNRIRACSLALMARVELKARNRKSAKTLKNDAEELLRRHAALSERNTFAEWTQSS